jgi:amidase
MKRVSRDKVCYAMSARNEAVLRVAAGEKFCLETEDCYSGVLKGPQDKMPERMPGFGNPATGPVYVEGAAPGDLLRVHIEKIRTRDYAVMRVEPGVGALPRHVAVAETVFLPIRRGELRLREGVRLPLSPMIGVIGTAPREGQVPTVTPGEHGGNMDCKEIGAGADVYLPVSVEGALLALGDVHAVMADGEVCVCGAEVSAEVTLRAESIRSPLPTPCVETAEHILFIASATTLDACEPLVLDKAHRFLTGLVGLSPNEAARLMSLVGELRICQVVDPLKTMKVMLPRRVLQALGWSSDSLRAESS